MSDYLKRLEKIEEIQRRKFPNEYNARKKAFSDWWMSLSTRQNKEDPDSFRTDAYSALSEAHEALWSLTYIDEEYKNLHSNTEEP